MPFGNAIIIGHAKPISHGAGYLFSDNRCAGEGIEEADVLACNHCQKLLVGKNWRDNGGFCGGCGQPMCAECADLFLLPPDKGGGCRPFIQQVEQSLNMAYHRRQMSKILGL